MNQCSSNGSSRAAVFLNQLVERRNGIRIAQHDGDLTATRNTLSFALGACLGVGHASGRLGDFRHSNVDCAFASQQGDNGTQGARAVASRYVIRDGLEMDAFRRGVRADHAVEVHGLLQTGRIPAMCESYGTLLVMSTPFGEVIA